MSIKLYSRNGDFYLDSRDPSHLRMVTSAVYSGEVMMKDTVTVKLVSTIELPFAVRDFISFQERLYFLNKPPKVTMLARREYEYTLDFEGGMYELSRVRFDTGAINAVNGFDMCGNLHDFCEMIVASLNNVAHGSPAALWTLDFEVENGNPVETYEKFLTYEHENCLAVLQDLMTKWPEWEWRVDVEEGDIDQYGFIGGALRLRRKKQGSRFTGENIDMAFGRSGGLSSVTRAPYRDEVDPNKIYFFGGSRNILNYNWTRVLLPNSYSGERSYMMRDPNIPYQDIFESVEIVDDIYPGNKPFSVLGYEGLDEIAAVSTSANVEGDTLVIGEGGNTRKVFEFTVWDGAVNPGTGQLIGARDFFFLFGQWLPRSQSSVWGCDYREWRQMYDAADTAENRNRYDEYYVGKSCYLANEKPTITFQTGDLAGMTFTVWNGYSEINEDGEATCTIICYCDNGTQEHTESEFEVAELNNTSVPNELVHPNAGDKFIIDGIFMPPRYLYYAGQGDTFSAEGQLKEYADAYMSATHGIKSFDLTVYDEWTLRKLKEHPGFGIKLFDSVTVDEPMMENYQSVAMRVVSLEYDILNKSYKKLGLSNYYGQSELNLLKKFLKSIRS